MIHILFILLALFLWYVAPADTVPPLLILLAIAYHLTEDLLRDDD